MSSPISNPGFPIPLLVNAATGMPMTAIPAASLPYLYGDLPGASQRIADSTHLGADYTVDDPNDLTQTGWGVIFASDVDPAIKAQLQPLLDLRQQQVQDNTLFKIFEGAATGGVLPGQTAASWAQQRGVSLTAPVDPHGGGVPYYLLLVGSPDRIPFEFQALLKMQWAVGRVAFDDVEDYGRYAQAVVEYESKSFRPVQSKNSAIWVTRNDGDIATAMLSGAICEDFRAPAKLLGARVQFNLDAYCNEKATKQQLVEILRGNLPGGPPAVFFTGSHGTGYPLNDPRQRGLQGAFLTQEWTSGRMPGPTNQFSADDIPGDAKLHGAMAFLFACYSGGCPADNNYYFNPDGSKIPVAAAPMIARLPQALLSRGALAVIAHIDLAFPYGFQDTAGTPQVQAIRTPLELLMRGKRVGFAADSLSVLWSARSAQLGMALGRGTASVPDPALAAQYIARDDARNYIVLGDPATRLRIADLA